jgi:hypothetical protein
MGGPKPARSMALDVPFATVVGQLSYAYAKKRS